MLRFVVGPDGDWVPDLAARLPGRGFWLAPERAVVDLALRKGAFPRAASRAGVSGTRPPPADLADRLAELSRRRAMEVLGLGRRAGQVIAGYEKVRAELAGGRVGLLVLASDAGADAQTRLGNTGALPRVDIFDREELGLALGRANVVHAAFQPGRLAQSFAAEAQRFAGLRLPTACSGPIPDRI